MTQQHEIYGREVRMGMVGGGPGAFIGEVHRKAARMDGQLELVAGAFSRDAARSRQQGAELYLDPHRVYGDYSALLSAESAMDPGERIDVLSIVTPNDSHFRIACDALDAGFHVILDKPMTRTLEEAVELKSRADRSDRVFMLTHNYTGYPMVKLARDLVAQGELGEVRSIKVQYAQGWLHTALESAGSAQAEWRTDPARSGAAGCMGDIGTHAENLVRYVTGLSIEAVCADLTSFVEGRRLEDDGSCLVRWQGGVKGLLHASQIAAGEENGLVLRVYGTKAGLEWRQEEPNRLLLKRPAGPLEVWRRGNGYVAERSPAAGRATRIPFGHPEGFIEAFANLYVNAAETIRARTAGKEPDPLALDFPTAEDGLIGMRFIDAVVRSSADGAVWVSL